MTSPFLAGPPSPARRGAPSPPSSDSDPRTSTGLPRPSGSASVQRAAHGNVPEFSGKRLGLIGTGLIGREVAAMGRGLGLEVVAWTFHPNPHLAVSLGVRYVELEELLQTSDIVSLHLRATPDT